MTKRYVIDVISSKAEAQLITFLEDPKTKGVRQVDSFDPVGNLTNEVQRVGLMLKEFKTNGSTWAVFNTYLRGKGISQGMIDAVTNGQMQFFRDMGIDIK